MRHKRIVLFLVPFLAVVLGLWWLLPAVDRGVQTAIGAVPQYKEVVMHFRPVGPVNWYWRHSPMLGRGMLVVSGEIDEDQSAAFVSRFKLTILEGSTVEYLESRVRKSMGKTDGIKVVYNPVADVSFGETPDKMRIQLYRSTSDGSFTLLVYE